MSTQYSQAVSTAREYYNSDDADNFYFTIWGGEDIHIGLYQSDDEPIADASRRTVEQMAARLSNLHESARVIDLGAGYGGSARYLAKKYGCHVIALNLSEVENERDRQMNREQKLDHLIDVVDASFESVPAEKASFDIVWSQDAFLHSGERVKVLKEIDRILKPGGELVFTDPMQADDCPEGVLQPILDRIHLETLGSPAFYREQAKKLGWEEVGFEEHTHQLVNHYSRVLAETERREEEIAGVVSREYIDRMKKGLGHWIEGGKKGYLSWGIFHFRKPS
ncbi:MAG: methyltransferase domain-containing protein [Phycisphaerales bacterium]|nr:MAG: methyltransferase domain-containing protein [Phycisphaerales bacterium]